MTIFNARMTSAAAGIAGAVLVLGLALSGQANACRPFVTEDAGVAGQGVMQMEVSADHVHGRNGNMETMPLFVPIYGVTKRLELSLELPYRLIRVEEADGEENIDQRGLGDATVVGKFLILEEAGPRPAFTLKAAWKTSSGDKDKGTGSGDEDFGLAAAVSKGWGPLTLHANLGHTFIGRAEDSNLKDVTLYGLAAGFHLTGKLHVAAEVAGSTNPDRTDPLHPLSGGPGLIYKFTEALFFDVAVKRGFNDALPPWSVTTGASITF